MRGRQRVGREEGGEWEGRGERRRGERRERREGGGERGRRTSPFLTYNFLDSKEAVAVRRPFVDDSDRLHLPHGKD